MTEQISEEMRVGIPTQLIKHLQKIKVLLIGYKRYEMRFAFTCSLRIEIIVMSRNTNVGRDSLHAKLVQATEVKGQANIETDFLIAI